MLSELNSASSPIPTRVTASVIAGSLTRDPIDSSSIVFVKEVQNSSPYLHPTWWPWVEHPSHNQAFNPCIVDSKHFIWYTRARSLYSPIRQSLLLLAKINSSLHCVLEAYTVRSLPTDLSIYSTDHKHPYRHLSNSSSIPTTNITITEYDQRTTTGTK